MDSSLRRFVIGLKLDEDIEPGLENARVTARWLPRLILPILLGTALSAWLDDLTTAALALGAGLLLLAVVYLLTQIRLANARNSILDKLEESSATLRVMLSKQVTEDVTHCFTKFLDTLNPAQATAAQVERDQSTQVERLRHLSDSFTTLEEQIKALTPAGAK
ncbi:hypothetical protein [Prosthecobacter sp.]|uniref:hypothetical protein n=1 Tax=Prosthecobacter sp. TaxID=1965333 RepID=UPI003784D055